MVFGEFEKWYCVLRWWGSYIVDELCGYIVWE